MLRSYEAYEFLSDLVAEGRGDEVEEVMKALELYRHDHNLWQRLSEVIENAYIRN